MQRIQNRIACSRPALRLVVALFGGLSLFAIGVAPARVARADNDPAPDARVAALERDFLMGMVPHHRGANMMAEMVLQKSQQPQLRDLAAKIIDEQTTEIIVMTAYLREWYGVEPPSGTMMPADIMMRMDSPMLRGLMPDMAAAMARLEQLSGPEFDIAFMQTMIDHHGMATMMAAPVLIVGYHPELYTLATQIVISQGEEIKQMQRWLEAWYGVEHP